MGATSSSKNARCMIYVRWHPDDERRDPPSVISLSLTHTHNILFIQRRFAEHANFCFAFTHVHIWEQPSAAPGFWSCLQTCSSLATTVFHADAPALMHRDALLAATETEAVCPPTLSPHRRRWVKPLKHQLKLFSGTNQWNDAAEVIIVLTERLSPE